MDFGDVVKSLYSVNIGSLARGFSTGAAVGFGDYFSGLELTKGNALKALGIGTLAELGTNAYQVFESGRANVSDDLEGVIGFGVGLYVGHALDRMLRWWYNRRSNNKHHTYPGMEDSE